MGAALGTTGLILLGRDSQLLGGHGMQDWTWLDSEVPQVSSHFGCSMKAQNPGKIDSG